MPSSEILYMIPILILTLLFVLSEISILTSAKAKLQKMAYANKHGAKQALKLLEMPNQFLSSVQVGITLLSIILGMYGGSSLRNSMSDIISAIPWGIGAKLQDYSEAIGYVLALTLVTYFNVIGEIFAKRIAMLYPEIIASYTSHFMRFFMVILYPFVFILTGSVKFLLAMLRIKEQNKDVSLDEVRFIINQAEISGNLRRNQRNMLQKLININAMHVKSIMVPRNKVIALDMNESTEINLEKLRKNDHSYFPVVKNGFNNIISIISTKTFFNRYVDNALIEKKARSTKAIFVPELSKVGSLIDLFRTERVKIASVIDEYGNVQGIVSFNDVIKLFLGDLTTSIEGAIPDIVIEAENSYLVAGNVIMDDVQELLKLHDLTGDTNYTTLANFMLHQFDNIPKKNDSFLFADWQFSVIAMDSFRIERVRISKYDEESDKA